MGRLQNLYFVHDCNASEDDKIVRLLMKKGHAGYGLYWMIIETLSMADNYELDCSYDELAYRLRTTEDAVKSVVEEFGLFVVADGRFYSARLSKNMRKIEAAREMNRKNGANGGNPMFKKGCPNPYYNKKDNQSDMHTDNREDNQSDIQKITYKSKSKNKSKSREKEEGMQESSANAVIRGASTTGEPPCDEILKLWNATCESLSSVQRLTCKRIEKIKARWAEFGDKPMDTLKKILDKIENSDFCKGGGRSGWKVSFDWLFENSNNWVKVYEGNYDNTDSVNKTEPSAKKTSASEGIRLGPGEYINGDGARTYGSGKDIVPNDAPPRPSERCCWSSSCNSWIM